MSMFSKAMENRRCIVDKSVVKVCKKMKSDIELGMAKGLLITEFKLLDAGLYNVPQELEDEILKCAVDAINAQYKGEVKAEITYSGPYNEYKKIKATIVKV